MIDDFYNEQEQWERVKRWLRENGPWLVAGVIIGLGALAGWRWWEARVERRYVEASAAYQQILKTLERGDRAAALKAVDELRAEYASSAYADQSDLLAARVHVDAGEFGPASERLTRVMQNSDDPQLQLVARVRLARVQIAQNDADAALKTLQGAEPGGFMARFDEVRGTRFMRRAIARERSPPGAKPRPRARAPMASPRPSISKVCASKFGTSSPTA